MKRAVYKEFGNPADVIRIEDVETPTPQTGEILVSMLRSPINPSDLLQVQGEYGIRPTLPATPGNEGIGRIAALGEGVDGLQVGQIVMLPAGIGAWQEQFVAPATGLFPLPEADLDQLGMTAVNPATAYLLLDDFADLQPGDWVVQNAGNSAVGGYVVQLAKARGLRTISIVRRPEAVDLIKELGGDVVLVDGPELEKDIQEAVGDSNLRLALDAVGGSLQSRMAELLSEGGVMVSYGALSGAPAVVSARATIFNDIQIRGFWLARWFREADAARKAEVFGALVGMIASGGLKAAVEAVYPLADIEEAVAHAARSGRSGKVLLSGEG